MVLWLRLVSGVVVVVVAVVARIQREGHNGLC